MPASTTATRGLTTRIPAVTAGSVALFPGTTDIGQESVAARRELGEDCLAAVAVVADARDRDEDARRGAELSEAPRQQACPVDAAREDRRFPFLGPPSPGDRFAGKVDDRVHPLQRGGVDPLGLGVPEDLVGGDRGATDEARDVVTAGP